MGSFFNFVLFIVLVTVGMFVGVLGVTYLYLGVFVNFMHYDFVTASSIFFMIVVFSFLLQFLILLFTKKEGRKQKPAIYFLAFVILYPLALSATINLYEVWGSPDISDALNAVAIYRHYVGLPVVFFLKAVSSVGALIGGLAPGPIMASLTDALSPFLGKFVNAFNFIEGHPLLRTLLVVMVSALFTRFITNGKKVAPMQGAEVIMA